MFSWQPRKATTSSIPLIEGNCALCGRNAETSPDVYTITEGRTGDTLRIHRQCAIKTPSLARDRIAGFLAR